jgi:hypothetical protein
MLSLLIQDKRIYFVDLAKIQGFIAFEITQAKERNYRD